MLGLEIPDIDGDLKSVQTELGATFDVGTSINLLKHEKQLYQYFPSYSTYLQIDLCLLMKIREFPRYFLSVCRITAFR